MFGAATEYVHEQAPNEPSCRRMLRAEYRYRADALELREEQVKMAYDAGQCTTLQLRWTDFEPARRISASDDGSWATSEAGSAPVNLDNAPIQAPPPKQKKRPQANTKANRTASPASNGPKRALPKQQSKKNLPPAQNVAPPMNQAPANPDNGADNPNNEPDPEQAAE